jgi:hypothetical protein
MNKNNKSLFTMVVLTFLLVQHFPATHSKSSGLTDPLAPVTGLISTSNDPLIKVDLNLCLIKSVGQFKTYCGEDYLEIVDLKAYLGSVFPNCFPNGIVIGNLLNGLHVHLTVLDAVHVFLGLNGGAGVLTASLTNPANCSGGIFAREILVLTINLGLDAFNPSWCISQVPLAQLVIKEGPCAGLTIAQVLALANSVIAGGPCPPGLTIDVLVDVLVKINLNFRAALVNHLYLAVPKLIAINANLAC